QWRSPRSGSTRPTETSSSRSPGATGWPRTTSRRRSGAGRCGPSTRRRPTTTGRCPSSNPDCPPTPGSASLRRRYLPPASGRGTDPDCPPTPGLRPGDSSGSAQLRDDALHQRLGDQIDTVGEGVLETPVGDPEHVAQGATRLVELGELVDAGGVDDVFDRRVDTGHHETVAQDRLDPGPGVDQPGDAHLPG